MPIYSDLNSINPTLQPLLVDVADIYQSLFNLFNTSPGERLFLPEFGFLLESSLFEIIDDTTAVDVFRVVNDAINTWENRIIIDNSRTMVTPVPDENKYELDLYFSVRGLEGQTFSYKGSFTQ